MTTELVITYVDGAGRLPLDRNALTLFVDGRPRTKGSMRHIGKGRMVEQVSGSTSWRQAVRECLAAKLGQEQGPQGPVRIWLPYDGAVRVDAQFSLPRSGATCAEPISRLTGDLDKLARNVGDALTDAGVIADDSQITQWGLAKMWTPPGGRAGVALRIDRA